MNIIKTGIEGLVEIIPTIYKDDRGWFFELFREDHFRNHGINPKFIQDNQSFSKKGVVRGLHLQLDPYAQGKLVSVISGKVLDVVVDLRKGSSTFGKVHYCTLDSERRNLLFVPEGFAHGFSALEDSIFFYKCTNTHHPGAEIGIRWNDPDLAIDWTVKEPLLSAKDKNHPTLNELLIKSVISRN
ncbi:dTDP-4-dehydrorhamnose 3,5-epimerase [Pseudochryseolinea flava]|uniref:dTDP-4-dehydrorhamnose 3,5-epimerase n=1 Tax=Pseudochryseolinea flava TaxID=2059302 RepID=A0A364XU37_9BACT|nr:dTDP-4-dehydrorhamnose 3,5-epimerase [Pseudochryseolinea flava]RAV97678.1 dTDP-4-dehydrorhamnose 3,5-epimerase [Pseudochryseolinea flava]